MKKKIRVRIALHSILILSLAACAAKNAYKQGTEQAQQGNWDAAVVHYMRAAREEPGNIQYRIALQRAIVEAANEHVKQANKYIAGQQYQEAVSELQMAVQLDPSNDYARSQLAATQERIREIETRQQVASEFEVRRARARELLSTQPVLEPSSAAPVNLKFAQETSLKTIFEVLSKLSGINVLFDESFRDKRVTIDLVDVSFKEALDKLVLINRLFYKVVDPSTLIIVPDNAQKHRQYDDLVLRTFFITNAEVNTIANMLRTIAGIQRVQPNPELKTITVRATLDQVLVAERIVQLNDKSKSEVLLDVEFLEINRSRAMNFGLELSSYKVGVTFDPAGKVNAERGDETLVRLNRLAAGDTSDWIMTFPSSAYYTLFKSKSEGRVLSSPRIRGVEGQAAELRLGQEIPVPVTTFVSQVGTGLANTPVTSFQYRNVGINVQITPKVFVDGTIELQLSLETSVLGEDRQISPGQSAPVFNTRNVTNVVRLRDGETNLIGGLISSTERRSTSGLPGITDVPILNKLFASNTDSSGESEVVFSVTPHIIRAPIVTDDDFAPLPMGTEQQVKVPTAESPLFTTPPPEPTPPPGPPAVPEVEPEVEEEAPEPTPEAAEPEAPAPEAPAPGEPVQPEAPPEQPPIPAGPISVLFNPPTTTVAVGDRVELALVAGGADGLSAGEITVSFDAAALEAVDVQPGPFLSIDGRQLSFAPVIEPGQIRIRFSRENDTLGLRGSGHLARIVFEVKSAGPPRIVSATGTLTDPAGGTIPASFASARIETR